MMAAGTTPPPHSTPRKSRHRPARTLVRVLVLFLLFAAPLVFGSVHRQAYTVLLVIVAVAAFLSLRLARQEGGPAPRLPGRTPILLLHLLVLIQLVPLPPFLLDLVSPGSLIFYRAQPNAVRDAWHGITVSPVHTIRGFAFLLGLSLFYGVVFRDFADRRWGRRLAFTVVAVAALMTIIAFVQKASAEPGKIYGLYRPAWDWAVFGPYVNHNHFVGHVVMAVPLALGFAAEAFLRMSRSWGRRARGWTALGDASGAAIFRNLALAIFVAAGILAAGSRAGVVALGVSLLAFPVAFRRRFGTALVLAAIVGAISLAWVDIAWFKQALEGRGLHASRVVFWEDQSRLLPDFPLFGTGFNAMGPVYRSRQSIDKYYTYDQTHNDYLQILIEGGIVGAACALALLVMMWRTALRSSVESALGAGLLGALAATCTTALVDFNWQIPANALTVTGLVGLIMARDRLPGSDVDPDAGTS
jgi:O-antigen ligase